MRWLWLSAGLTCVGIGGIGIVVPGLPSTIFFILAAGAFTRSSPRLEAWVLDLPGVGQAVRDYREGRGMPRRAKVAAVASIILFGGGAALFAFSTPAPRVTVLTLCVVGIVVVLRQPTKDAAPT